MTVRADNPGLLRSPRVASLLTAAFVAGAAAVQLRLGQDAAPAPLRELFVLLFDHDPATAARLVVAAEFAVAAAVLVAGTRVLAIAGAVAAAFASLATVSHAASRGGMALPIVSLVLSVGLAVLATRSVAVRPSNGRRGLSPAWSALLALAAATFAAQWTASASFRTASQAPSAPTPPKAATLTAPSIDLDMHPFLDKPLAESTLARYVPKVVELCAGRDAFVIVYSPSCESCHTLFRETFNVPRHELVVAVAIPLSADAVSAASEEPRPIECLDCEELTLPQGPNWLVAPPLVLKVERGVITCVADRFGGDCLPK